LRGKDKKWRERKRLFLKTFKGYNVFSITLDRFIELAN